MRIGFVADVHLGNHRKLAGDRVASLNRRCRDGLDVFSRAVARSIALGCSAFVVLGDLFDSQKPEPQLIAAVQAALLPAVVARMHVYLVVGNHDQVSDAAGDHALGPLSPMATVVDRPVAVNVCGPHGESVVIGLVPFRAGAPAAEWLPDAVRTIASVAPPAVLGVHLGIRDGTTAPWLRGASDAIGAEQIADLAREVGAGYVLAGNWHDRRAWAIDGVGVLQLGALIPTGWDNPGLRGYGTLAVWEDGAVFVEELPGPRFAKVDAAELAGVAATCRASGCRLYAQVTAPPDQLSAAVSSLAAVAGAQDDLVGEVVVDGTAVEECAREAASAASAASSLADAAEAFLATMPLDDGVPRAKVSAVVRGYLGLPGGETA